MRCEVPEQLPGIWIFGAIRLYLGLHSNRARRRELLAHFLIAVLLALVAAAGLLGSEAVPCERVCADPAREVMEGVTARASGKPYVVPDLSVRFSDSKTGVPIAPEYVEVAYSWTVTEGLFKKCSMELRMECHARAGELLVPGFEIRPWSWMMDRDWLDLPALLQPYSVQVEITTVGALSSHSILLWGVDKFDNNTLHVAITDSGPFEYWNEAPNGDQKRVNPGPAADRRQRRF